MESSNVAVVFAGPSTLDQADCRYGVLRIPEVTLALRESQSLIEKFNRRDIDLRACLLADDREFNSNRKLKALVSAIVQIALYNRWSKFNAKPNYLIGSSNLESALQYAAGRKSLEEVVRQSSLICQPEPESAATKDSLPILNGRALLEYEVSILNYSTQKYICIRSQEMESLRLFSYIADQLPIDKLVNVGPGCPLFSNYNKILFEKKIQVLDSIDSDPMLSWFWTSIKPEGAISQ